VAKKLGNEGFLSKAPADVIEKVRQKQSALLEKQQKIQANLDKIKEVEA
jgi:valyl-tRNA synthetase